MSRTDHVTAEGHTHVVEYTLHGTLRVYLVIVDLKRDQMSNTMSCARYRASFSTLLSLTLSPCVFVFRRWCRSSPVALRCPRSSASSCRAAPYNWPPQTLSRSASAGGHRPRVAGRSGDTHAPVCPASVSAIAACGTRGTYIFTTYPLLSTLVITALGDWDRPAVAPSRTHSAVRANARARCAGQRVRDGFVCAHSLCAYIKLVQALVCATHARNCACHLLVRVNCRLLFLPLSCHILPAPLSPPQGREGSPSLCWRNIREGR